MTHCLVLGRTPDLAFLEAKSLFPSSLRVTKEIAAIIIPNQENKINILNKLGGTVKVAEIVGTMTEVSAVQISQFFPKNQMNLNFGLSIYGDIKIPSGILQDTKKILNKYSTSIRFIESKHDFQLSSVTVTKNKVYELILFKLNSKIIVARTCSIQDYKNWALRDYGRPYSDPKSGMLPPKVTRMILNIAVGNNSNATILDPFCGMGTVIAEAALLGIKAIGSDFSREVIAKAQLNIEWLTAKFNLKASNIKLIVGDAVKISKLIPMTFVDAVVTEPFMGRSDLRLHQDKIHNTVKGLEKLYTGCLKDWKYLLKPNGKIIMSLPVFVGINREYPVKKPIDMCENLGYTRLLGPIEYARDFAFLRRKFYLFSRI